ncbi:MAG TPA: thiol-activated cytolysin family protein [Haliangiales bacterium]|nr:thiol-activated cytolysin family protein [Haliangiales bacterium]
MARSSLWLATALATSAACGAAAPDGTPDPAKAIDDYVAALAALRVDPPGLTQGPKSDPARDGDYSCTTQNLAETRQFDKVVAFAANSESLWPGAIVRGDSLYTGLFTQIVLPRAPLTFSVSLENLAGRKSATLEGPSLAAYREAMGRILDAEVTGATPANIGSEIEKVQSSQQLTLALGANVSWPGDVAKVSASFHFDDRTVKSRYVVKFTQAYYTVDVDQPRDAAAFLADRTTVADLDGKMGPGNPPVYVSSITYGRLVVFTFESEYSAEEMGAALEFLYRGGADVSGDTSVTYKDILSRSRISFFILGGSGQDAAGVIDGYDKLVEFVKKGGNYSKDSPGAPIAYKLAYLKDNVPARMSWSYDYQVKDCVRVTQKVQVVLRNIYVETASDAGGDLEIYGSVSAYGAGATQWLFDKDSSQYVKIAGGETFPAQGVLGEAVVDVTPAPGGTIHLGAALWDYDPTSANDALGSEERDLPFDLGWRKDVQLLFTGSASRVWVSLHLEPI